MKIKCVRKFILNTKDEMISIWLMMMMKRLCTEFNIHFIELYFIQKKVLHFSALLLD